MPALEPVIATLLLNLEPFMEEMSEVKAEMASLADEAAASGEETGAALSAGAVAGAEGLEDELGAVGADAGAALRTGATDAAEGLEGDLGAVGGDAGLALRDEASEAASGLRGDLSTIGSDAGVALSSGVKDGTRDLESDLATIGGDAGLALTGGVKDASSDLKDDLGVAGSDAGAALSTGVQEGSAGIEDAMDAAGAGAGLALTGGVKEGAGAFKDELGEAGASGGKALESGAKEGLTGVKGMLAGLGVPEFLLGGWGELAVAVGGVGAVALDLGEKMQTAEATIATATGSSIKSAEAIGNAFLATGMHSEFSGREQAEAYAQVAGQLKSTQGQTLDTAQAMDVMTAAGNLATAKQVDLGTSTSALASAMQAFQISAKGAAGVSNILFNASNSTGQSLTAVGNALDKVKTKLGGMAPPLGQLSALLVDMTDHGETGRAAMSALTTTFTTFLKPAADLATAQNNLKVATDALPASLQTVAAAYQSGKITGSGLTYISDGLSTSQQGLWSAFTKAADAAQTATQAQAKMGITTVNAKGQMVPMVDIIAQLQDKIKGMGTAQAIATLSSMGFGNASAKLVETIQAGPAAYAAAAAAVTKVGSAQHGAAVQGSTLSVMFKTLKSAAADLEEHLGTVLIPVLDKLVGDFVKALPSIEKFVDDGIRVADKAFGDLKKAFETALPTIKRFVDDGLKLAEKAFLDLKKPIEDIFIRGFHMAKDAVHDLVGPIEEIVKSIVETLIPTFEAVWNIARDLAPVIKVLFGVAFAAAVIAVKGLALALRDIVVPIADFVHWMTEASAPALAIAAIITTALIPAFIKLAVDGARAVYGMAAGIYSSLSGVLTNADDFAGKFVSSWQRLLHLPPVNYSVNEGSVESTNASLESVGTTAEESAATTDTAVEGTAATIESSNAAVESSLASLQATMDETAANVRASYASMGESAEAGAATMDEADAAGATGGAEAGLGAAGAGAGAGLATTGAEADGAAESLDGVGAAATSILGPLALVAGVGLGGYMLATRQAKEQTQEWGQVIQGLTGGPLAMQTSSMAQISSKLQALHSSMSTIDSEFKNGTINMYEYVAAQQRLQAGIADTGAAQTNYTTNLAAVQKQTGLTAGGVRSLASSLNVNLSTATNAWTSAVRPSAIMKAALASQAQQAGMTASSLVNLANQTGQSTTQIANDVVSAGRAATQGWSNFTNQMPQATGAGLSMTKSDLVSFYQGQITQGADFVANIRKAVADGYDPSYIAKLSQEGPEEAGQLLQALVSQSSSSMVSLVNGYQTSMTTAATVGVRSAQLLGSGVTSILTHSGAETAEALGIQTALAGKNAEQGIAYVEKAYNIGLPQIQAIATSYGIALPNAITAQVSKVPTILSSQTPAIVSAIKAQGGAISTAAGTLGGDFSVGLANGITENISVIQSAANQAAQVAISTGRSTVRASSPSREAADKIGKPIAQGIATGILENLSLVDNASKKIALQAISSAQGNLGGLFGSGLGNLSINNKGAVAPLSVGGGPTQATVLTGPIVVQINGNTIAQSVYRILLQQGRANGNIFGGYAGGNQTGVATGINPNAVAR